MDHPFYGRERLIGNLEELWGKKVAASKRPRSITPWKSSARPGLAPESSAK